MVKQVSDPAEFKQIISDSKLVVVDFTATWCGPCKMIAPKFAQMSETYTDVVFIKVDVDDASEIAEEWGISAMPTFLFFKNGQKLTQFSGASVAKLEEEIKNRK